MYVCLCNGVTERELLEAAAESTPHLGARCAASFAEDVADRLGAGLGCGTCREFAVALVEQAAASRSSAALSDRARVPLGLDTRPGPCSEQPFSLSAGRNEGALLLQGA